MTEDSFNALQMLAADNARLCERLIAAEKVVEETRLLLRFAFDDKALRERAREALRAYDAARPS